MKSTLAIASSATCNSATRPSEATFQLSSRDAGDPRASTQQHARPRPPQPGGSAAETECVAANVCVRVQGEKTEEASNVVGPRRVVIGNLPGRLNECVGSQRRASCPPCAVWNDAAPGPRLQNHPGAQPTLTPFHTERRMSAPPAVKREWIADTMWQSGSLGTWLHASPPVVVDPDSWYLADVDRAEVWRRQREEYHAAVRERRAQLEGFINPVVQLLHSDTIPDEDSIMSDATPPTGFLHAQLAS